ncbi:MAG: hypothetical protein R2800_09950 [Flavipsychrobacter sp.]
MQTIGVKQLLQKKFKELQFEGRWQASFGNPEVNFKCLIHGESGNGKTRFCVMYAKYLTQFKKVLYVSEEEGISKTIQQAFRDEDMHEVSKRLILAEKTTFTELVDYLSKRNRPDIIFIDSLDYLRLTTEQFKQLVKLFPKKSFVIVAWGKGDFPKSQYAKDVEFMCDIKIRVNKYVAYPRSRFGGNLPFIIWEERVSELLFDDPTAYPKEVARVLEHKDVQMDNQDIYEEE